MHSFLVISKAKLCFGCQSFLIKESKEFLVLCEFELAVVNTEHLNVKAGDTYYNHYALRSSLTSW
jgi:hypothetical protein